MKIALSTVISFFIILVFSACDNSSDDLPLHEDTNSQSYPQEGASGQGAKLVESGMEFNAPLKNGDTTVNTTISSDSTPPESMPPATDHGPAYRCVVGSDGKLTGKCTTDGAGPFCSALDDLYPCEEAKDKFCSENGQCVPFSQGGTGESCHSDDSCNLQKQCAPNGTCRTGRNSGLTCNTDGDCQVKRCNKMGACVLGGKGIECKEDKECPKKYCSQDRCYSGHFDVEPYAACDSHTDCTEEKFCNEEAKCVAMGGWGRQMRCSADSDCANIKTCLADKCMPGINDGIRCTSSNECQSIKTCFNGVCRAGRGGTARCTSNSECSHLNCIEGTCKIRNWPGVHSCSVAGKPCERKFSPPSSPSTIQEGSIRPTSDKAVAQLSPQNVMMKLAGVQPSVTFGRQDAKIAMVIFHDIDCGQCKRFMRENFELLSKQYVEKGLLKISFYEFPLIANNEVLRHHGALCAAEQDQYINFVVQTYSAQKLTVEQQNSFAKSLAGLEFKKWEKCMSNSQKLTKNIKSHIDLGKLLGVDGTPTIFVNGISIPNFKDKIFNAINTAIKPSKNKGKKI